MCEVRLVCERCEREPPARKMPESPVRALHDKLVVYPDLMVMGKTYQVEYRGRLYLVAKTDIGVLSIMEVEMFGTEENQDA